MIIRYIFILLTLLSSNSFAETYTEQYGEIEVSSSIFFDDVEGDDRKNNLNTSSLKYNFFFENNNLSGKLKINSLFNAIKEIQRVGRKHYICVESYRNNKELF